MSKVDKNKLSEKNNSSEQGQIYQFLVDNDLLPGKEFLVAIKRYDNIPLQFVGMLYDSEDSEDGEYEYESEDSEDGEYEYESEDSENTKYEY